MMLLASVNVTLFPLVITTVPKLFAAVLRVMLLAAPPTKVIVPGTTNAPLWVNPAPVAVKFPVNVIACKSNAVVSCTLTFASVPEEAAKETLPVKVFACATLIVLPPTAVNVLLPPTVKIPPTVWLIVVTPGPAAVEITLKSPPKLEF